MADARRLMATNEEMVARLKGRAIVKSATVDAAMRAVDRGEFCGSYPYTDCPQDLGFGATISAPQVHGQALELLLPALDPGNRVLDVGCGSGYLCACIAHLVGRTGVVVGIDHIPELVELARTNISKSHKDLLDSGVVKLFCGDGRLGYPPLAQYDAIHVGAAASSIPLPLIEQLKPGGRLLMPVGKDTGLQRWELTNKSLDGELTTRTITRVRFVSLS